MVGKIKHVRQKLHQEAVRLERPSSLAQPPGAALPRDVDKPVVSGRLSPSPPPVDSKTDASKNVKKVCKNCLDKCYLWLFVAGHAIESDI